LRQQPAEKPPTTREVTLESGVKVIFAADFKHDNHTIFLVIDEGDEDSRLTAAVLEAFGGAVKESRVVNHIPLMRLSERHSIAPVYRRHVRQQKDMKKWPIYVGGVVGASMVGPFSCAPYFNSDPSAASIDDDGAGESGDELGLINHSALCNAIGQRILPATLKVRKEDDQRGLILRMRYA
jgi:hypothetical protein